LHDAQARDGVADAVVVGDSGFGDSPSSAWPATAFLNSFLDFPSELAISGSRLAPNTKIPIPRRMRRSWYPNTARPLSKTARGHLFSPRPACSIPEDYLENLSVG